jgi:exosortase/archaeosortase family protein
MIVNRQVAATFVSRNELFAGLAAVGFVNGISERVSHAVADTGIAAALVSTFDISAIVWGAWVLSLVFLLRSPTQSVSRSDWLVATGALLAFLVPVVPLSWLALAALAIHLLRTPSHPSLLHRGAWILLALTVPMFWSRLLFAALSGSILQADATLVGWLVGTPRLGNAIQFVDGSGYLWIAPACSSLANVSLAILCWVTVAKVSDRRGSLWDLVWVALACLAVIVINVSRISLLGLYPEHFDLIHGSVGAAAASWLILGVTVAICLFGARRELAARASFSSDLTIRPSLSIGVGMVLAVTVFLKVPGLTALAFTAPEATVFPGEVTDLLQQRGFAVRQIIPVDDLAWVYGTAEGCQVQVTEVAPQGWQRSLLTRVAGERRLVFLFGGEAYSEQPVLKTRADYYWGKLNRYLGRRVPRLPVLAVISISGCEQLPLRELADLSGR